MRGNKKLRTVVCGSRFGQFYLQALQALSDQFELVGLVAKGSARSQACATRYGIPLYTEVAQLPSNIDLACVVLRSGVMGGKGTELACQLLARGIHVIQEHPVHHQDLATCFRTARQYGVQFRVGNLYVHLPAVRRFIACARVLLEQQQALYLDAACASQVSLPLMHIWLECLPSIRPWHITHVSKDEGPFQVVTGSLGQIPITLRIHHEVDPQDPDNHLHLLHRMTIGVAGGSLSLLDTHGPVIWQPRLHVPDVADIADQLGTRSPAHLRADSTSILGPATTWSYKDILCQQWPYAIGRDLLALQELIVGNRPAAMVDTKAQQELLCARQWQQLTQLLGYPVLRPNCRHEPLSVDKLLAAANEIVADYPQTGSKQTLPCTANDDVLRCTEPAEKELQGIQVEQVEKCVELLEEAVLYAMLYTLQRQGVFTSTEQLYREDNLCAALQIAPRHIPIIARWLHHLKQHGILQSHAGYVQSTKQVTLEQMHHYWQVARAYWSEHRLGPAAVIDYFIHNVEQLPQLMNDEQQATFLLFPEGRMDIAHALYQDTRIARYVNQSVAEAVIRIAGRKQGACKGLPTREKDVPLRMLELGAGTGATTAAVVQRLDALHRAGVKLNYWFTDRSHFFLSAARTRFKTCTWLHTQLLNIDDSFVAQGVAPASMDIVLAAGMLNNARHIEQTVARMMQCLMPGGWLLITEPTRECVEMLISQAFMMTHPEDDRQNGQTNFMTVTQWSAVFQRAGASEITVFPAKGHPLAPLGQQLFIVRKGTNAEM